ncbi:MAG: hypothetical protein KF902_00530 [Phycisphaeraceae bacterium]|nr:hypothetical protein [Phycisphaeraceae bacterium]
MALCLAQSLRGVAAGLGLGMAASFAGFAEARPIRYEFRIVATGSPSGEFLSVSLSRPSIGNNGRVLFSAQYQDASGAVLLEDHGLTWRLSTEGRQPSWQNQISRDGRVAAWIEETPVGNLLKRWTDGSIDLSDPVAGGWSAGFRVVVNDDGAIAYDNYSIIRRLSAFGVESTIGGPGSDIIAINGIPSMTDSGDVVWTGNGNTTDGLVVWQNDSVIVDRDTLDHTNQVATSGSGLIAFVARPNPYSIELPTLFTYDNGTIATRHATLQQYPGGSDSHLGINDLGDVVYPSQPSETEPYGLWVYRADGSRQLIVAEGDVVTAGDTPVHVWRITRDRTVGPRSINDHGQVAFYCYDGSSASEYILVATPFEVCPADYNNDDLVDVLDFLDFFDDFGQCDQLPAPCGTLGNPDLNGDTLIDILDFLDFLDAFGTGC